MVNRDCIAYNNVFDRVTADTKTHQFIGQKDQSTTYIDMHEIHVETVSMHVYTKYKTHYYVYTQDNQLNKNTLQYGSSTSGVRYLLNLLSDLKLVLLGSEVHFLYECVIETIRSYVRFAGWEVQFIIVT